MKAQDAVSVSTTTQYNEKRKYWGCQFTSRATKFFTKNVAI